MLPPVPDQKHDDMVWDNYISKPDHRNEIYASPLKESVEKNARFSAMTCSMTDAKQNYP